MINKKAMGMHWYILIISFFISVGIIMYYEFIDSPIPKVGEYSVIIGKTLEKESIIPSLIERVMEDINKQSTVRFNDHIEFLDLLDSDCNGNYENNLGRRGRSGFTIPRITEGISELISGKSIPEEEFGESTYCHMDRIRAKNKFRIIFINNYNYFKRHNNFDDLDFNLAGLQYSFTNPSEESGEFFIKMTVGDGNPGLIFPITKEGGGTLGNYRIRPNFKLPVDYEFNNFDDTSTLPNEMCLFVAGCADFDDVVERYPGLYEVKEEPCDYYDSCAYAADAAQDVADAAQEAATTTIDAQDVADAAQDATDAGGTAQDVAIFAGIIAAEIATVTAQDVADAAQAAALVVDATAQDVADATQAAADAVDDPTAQDVADAAQAAATADSNAQAAANAAQDAADAGASAQDVADAAQEAAEDGDITKDDFGKYYETERFLCSGDCIPPPCSLDDEALTQRRLPTNCQDNSCGSYYSCFTTDCDCSAEAGNNACTGDCKPYCSSYDPTKTIDVDTSTHCRTDCSNYFDCTVSALDCYCTPSTKQCSGSCVPYCSTPQAPDYTFCRKLPCSEYYNCDSIDPSDKCYCPTTLSPLDIEACETIDETDDEQCPSCKCTSEWTDSGACGKLGCDWNKVPQSRTCMPGGCDSETRCDIRDSCDCLLDADADTKCMDNPCNSYVPGTCDSTSDCGCLNGYSCSGDCVDCDYDSWENVGGCGDPCLVDEVLQKRESTNECTPQTRCNSDAICTGV